jgi:hypothetical protein
MLADAVGVCAGSVTVIAPGRCQGMIRRGTWEMKHETTCVICLSAFELQF